MYSIVKMLVITTTLSSLFVACSQAPMQSEETPVEVIATETMVTPTVTVPPVQPRTVAAVTTTPSKVDQLLAKLYTQQSPQQLTLALDQEWFDQKSKADLLPTALNDLKKIADFLSKNPQWQISVASYPNGMSDYHWGLSERQASAIRFALIQQGVASNRIAAQGFVGQRSANTGRTSHLVEMTMILNYESVRYLQ